MQRTQGRARKEAGGKQGSVTMARQAAGSIETRAIQQQACSMGSRCAQRPHARASTLQLPASAPLCMSGALPAQAPLTRTLPGYSRYSLALGIKSPVPTSVIGTTGTCGRRQSSKCGRSRRVGGGCMVPPHTQGWGASIAAVFRGNRAQRSCHGEGARAAVVAGRKGSGMPQHGQASRGNMCPALALAATEKAPFLNACMRPSLERVPSGKKSTEAPCSGGAAAARFGGQAMDSWNCAPRPHQTWPSPCRYAAGEQEPGAGQQP